MSRLWSSGFELQSAATGIEWDTSTGTMSISTSTKRSGAAALRCNPTAATGFLTHTFQADTINRTFHRFYLNIATLPSADTVIYGYGDSGNVYPVLVRLKTTGVIQFHDSANYIGTASSALSTGVWYRIEVDYTDNATLASTALVGYINGTNFSGTALTSQQVAGGGRIRLGVQTTCTADLYFDDVAVNSNGGGAQSGLPGPGAIVHLLPDSAGDNNGWATAVGGTAGAANNFTRVNETTPNDATSYNQTALTGTTTIDDLNCGSSASAGIGGSDAITLVQVGARIGSIAATAASIVTRVKSQAAGTVLESGSTSVALNGWSTHAAASPKIYALTSYVDPQAAGPWTTALLDTMQIGYRGNVSQTTTRRVSALWALVEYTPGGAAALTAATALTAAGQTTTGGATAAAALTAATALTAAGTADRAAAAALATATALGAAATPDRPATATLSAVTALAAAATREVPGAAGLAAATTLTADATPVRVATATLGAATALTTTATADRPAVAALAAAATLTAAATPTRLAAATLGAATALTAAGITTTTAAAALGAATALTAAAGRTTAGAANLAAATALTAAGSTGNDSSADLTAGTGITAAGAATAQGGAELAAATVLAATATAGHPISAALTAAATLDADGTTVRAAAAVLSTATNLDSAAAPERPAAAVLTAVVALTTDATQTGPPAAQLTAAAVLGAFADDPDLVAPAVGTVTTIRLAATAVRPTATAVVTLRSYGKVVRTR